jgi:CRP/FNR family transcriptional regulator, cyclic AMP receptor protein
MLQIDYAVGSVPHQLAKKSHLHQLCEVIARLKQLSTCWLELELTELSAIGMRPLLRHSLSSPVQSARALKAAMKTPYGLQIIENCLTCPLHRDRLFCNLAPPILSELDSISASATYPKGAVLFVEGQDPRGVFVVCNGRVKMSASSRGGKSLILRIAQAGEIIGLPGTISGRPYEVTAEALEPIQANFIPRKPFLEFLGAHGVVALRIAEALSEIYYTTYQEVRCLGLSGSVEEKLAGFLLNLVANKGSHADHDKATLTLTHQEIAEMVGTSRETVTRLLADFKRKRLVEIHGATVVIMDRPGLRHLLEA